MSAWGQGLRLKLNEGGASDAFFFFSADKRFLVKSTTVAEMELLRNISKEYANHLTKYTESFLVRIYGAFNLVVYGTSFRFFVMENLFHHPRKEIVIHERYDVKGSWVNRNFSAPSPGNRVTCRLCNEKYTVGEKASKCVAHAQGMHIPNVRYFDFPIRFYHAIERRPSSRNLCIYLFLISAMCRAGCTQGLRSLLEVSVGSSACIPRHPATRARLLLSEVQEHHGL